MTVFHSEPQTGPLDSKMTLAIQTQGLTRAYRTYEKPEGLWNSVRGLWNRKYIDRVALAPTTLEIGQGQIVGLVGANGAGKTTLLKLLSGLIHPSAGDAKVLGYRPWERKNEYLRRISILLGQKNQLWWDIAPVESYALLAKIYDLDESAAKKRYQDLAEILGCAHVLKVQLRRLSLGERMKMEVIGALLHEPEVMFLDEPTIGLDVVAQKVIRDFVADYVKRRKPTVILTSHYMDDIARLADRLLLISKGAIVYDGSVGDFSRGAQDERTVTAAFEAPLSAAVSLPGGNFAPAGEVSVQVKVVPQLVGPTVSALAAAGALKDLKLEEADFEDVIRRFLEKESRVFPARGANAP